MTQPTVPINPNTGLPVTGDEPEGTFEYGTEEYWYWKDTLGPETLKQVQESMVDEAKWCGGRL